jgi:hypothetical protein
VATPHGKAYNEARREASNPPHWVHVNRRSPIAAANEASAGSTASGDRGVAALSVLSPTPPSPGVGVVLLPPLLLLLLVLLLLLLVLLRPATGAPLLLWPPAGAKPLMRLRALYVEYP